MTLAEEFSFREIVSHFQLDGQFVSAHRFGSGHINDTFLVSVDGDSDVSNAILQRVDKNVFKDPAALMQNISRVTDHLKKKNAKCLTLIPTVDAQSFYKCRDDENWRMYEFVAGAVTYDKVPNTKQARVAAAMFGGFQELVADLPGPRLNETIADFHNTPVRYSHFHAAVREDTFDRVRHCQ